MKKQNKLISVLPLSLLPISTYGQRLSGDLIPAYQWTRIKRWTYQQSNYCCDVCGGVGKTYPVEAHEVWNFDDKKYIQKLQKVIALCPLCHQTVHLRGTLVHKGKKAYKKCIEHLVKLNKWDWLTAQMYIEQETTKCLERSKYIYEVNIKIKDKWLKIINQNPPSWP